MSEQAAKEFIDSEIKKLKRQKEKIEEAEKVKNKEAHDLAVQLQKLKIVRDKTEIAIITTRQKLLKLCTHEKTHIEEHDYSGSYLDRAEHHKITVCDWCGEEIDKEVSYGGYG